MLQRSRRKLRQISYYSRSRQRTVWTRALDLALPASLALAVPVTLAGEAMVERARTAEEATGVLIGNPAVEVRAPVVAGDHRWNHEDGVPYGEWTLVRYVVTRGWPFASKTSHARASVDINIFSEPRLRVNARLDRDAPARVAIEDALVGAGRADLREAWGAADSQSEREWLGSVLNVGAWWVMLFVASAVVIRALSLFALLFRAKRHVAVRDRSRAGVCANCKYDLRGLEFSERCPECGALVH